MKVVLRHPKEGRRVFMLEIDREPRYRIWENGDLWSWQRIGEAVSFTAPTRSEAMRLAVLRERGE